MCVYLEDLRNAIVVQLDTMKEFVINCKVNNYYFLFVCLFGGLSEGVLLDDKESFNPINSLHSTSIVSTFLEMLILS